MVLQRYNLEIFAISLSSVDTITLSIYLEPKAASIVHAISDLPVKLRMFAKRLVPPLAE